MLFRRDCSLSCWQHPKIHMLVPFITAAAAGIHWSAPHNWQYWQQVWCNCIWNLQICVHHFFPTKLVRVCFLFHHASHSPAEALKHSCVARTTLVHYKGSLHSGPFNVDELWLGCIFIVTLFCLRSHCRSFQWGRWFTVLTCCSCLVQESSTISWNGMRWALHFGVGCNMFEGLTFRVGWFPSGGLEWRRGWRHMLVDATLSRLQSELKAHSDNCWSQPQIQRPTGPTQPFIPMRLIYWVLLKWIIVTAVL